MTLFRGVGATGGTPKSMFAYLTNVNRYMTFEQPAGADYVVTAGKTFKITRIIYFAVGTAQISIGYGDNGVAEGAAAPTNPVYVLGNGTAGFHDFISSAFRANPPVIDIYAEIPAGKYPFLRSIVSSAANPMVTLIGIEE